MPANDTVSDAECLEMSREHVTYEIQMLNYCALRINGSESQEQNLYIEGFALHLRNLLEFLFKPIPTDPRFDDIRAEHFFNPDKWQRIRGEKDLCLKEAEERAHKQLAHLTRSRQRKRRWEFTAILKMLAAILKLFLAHARQELIHEAFRFEVESLEKTANRPGVALSGTTTSTSYPPNCFIRMVTVPGRE